MKTKEKSLITFNVIMYPFSAYSFSVVTPVCILSIKGITTVNGVDFSS